ncbi:MAG: acetolactate synthase large subunit, partial [Rhodococcus sp.]|nr:acetolactate synthase large subunit [Rhodococcus sp. (in: high G+C Gram-positive bacteria)]
MSAPTARPQPTPRKSTQTGTTPAAAQTGNRRALAPERVTGAQSVVRSLEELEVDTVFGIPGGAVLPVYDPLFDSKKVRHVLVRHEQGAGHAATGYAQATGKVGVCMATSG